MGTPKFYYFLTKVVEILRKELVAASPRCSVLSEQCRCSCWAPSVLSGPDYRGCLHGLQLQIKLRLCSYLYFLRIDLMPTKTKLHYAEMAPVTLSLVNTVQNQNIFIIFTDQYNSQALSCHTIIQFKQRDWLMSSLCCASMPLEHTNRNNVCLLIR